MYFYNSCTVVLLLYFMFVPCSCILCCTSYFVSYLYSAPNVCLTPTECCIIFYFVLHRGPGGTHLLFLYVLFCTVYRWMTWKVLLSLKKNYTRRHITKYLYDYPWSCDTNKNLIMLNWNWIWHWNTNKKCQWLILKSTCITDIQRSTISYT